MSGGRSGGVTCVSRRAAALALAAAAAFLLVLVDAGPVRAADLTVTNTADPGNGTCDAACTLREAITTSNGTSATDTIKFDIPDGPEAGFEVKTISPDSQLPVITDGVTIDGYTQAGAVANTATTNANSAVPKIELNGTGTGANASGLIVAGDGAAGTTIKGLIVNRFGNHGVQINADDTTVEGSFIGTNAAGDADLGNSGAGVLIQSSENLIGGPANAAQNVISGNGGHGVSVEGAASTGNVVSNNHIGTDADAGEDLGNTGNGVAVASPGVVVGGSGPDGAGKDDGSVLGEGNIISGNDGSGVFVGTVDASGTRVLGNFIGVNLNGNGFSNIGNSLNGVHVVGAPGVEVGGTGATFSNGEGNTISDNGRHGVETIGTSSTDHKILGNRIGTDFNGNSDFGNTLDGVHLSNSSNTTVGGMAAGARNVVSGNEDNGVVIAGSVIATSNKVQGNLVGTDATGRSDLGNGEVGVLVVTPRNFVGGTAAGARNVVSGNGGVGVSLLGAGADDNTVQGNFIGTDADGEVSPNNLGNFHGVFVSEGSGNTIGGTVPAAANVISGNANHGVMVIGDTATGNSILRNSISENGSPGGLGIELSNGGVTPNDPRDPDAGPNTLQNFPVITSAGATRIAGTLNSRPGKTFTVQFFSSPAPNFPTGFGEGETFIGQKRVTTNRKGKASFTFSTTLFAGQVVTATATNAGGSTSEFSQGRTVG